MYRITLALCVVTLVAAAPLGAQSIPTKTPEQIAAAVKAHQGDFDYLLGDWEFTTEHKEFGTANGVWSAVRLSGGQVLDEYRLLDEHGETFYMTTTIRNYNAVLDRWELMGMDRENGLQEFGTGRRAGDEVHIEQRFDVMTSQPTTLRIRYYDIQPDRFSWTADQSRDDGKTWTAQFIRIEARRVGPARTLDPLAVPRKR